MDMLAMLIEWSNQWCTSETAGMGNFVWQTLKSSQTGIIDRSRCSRKPLGKCTGETWEQDQPTEDREVVDVWSNLAKYAVAVACGQSSHTGPSFFGVQEMPPCKEFTGSKDNPNSTLTAALPPNQVFGPAIAVRAAALEGNIRH